MAPDDRPRVKIGLRDNDGDVETPWATHLGGRLYRLDNVPFFAYGVSADDVVEAVPDQDGLPMVNRVVQKSGNRTVRVWLPETTDTDPAPTLLAELARLGCTYEGAYNKLICINVPPAVPLDSVADLLVRLDVEWEYADPPYEDLFPSDSQPPPDAT